MIDTFESDELITFVMKCDGAFCLHWINGFVHHDYGIIALVAMKGRKLGIIVCKMMPTTVIGDPIIFKVGGHGTHRGRLCHKTLPPIFLITIFLGNIATLQLEMTILLYMANFSTLGALGTLPVPIILCKRVILICIFLLLLHIIIILVTKV